MCVYLTDVPISNVLLSAQSRCFCMYCNFSFDLRLLLCIVSKAHQARCCAWVLINILFFPEFQESSLEFVILPPIMNNSICSFWITESLRKASHERGKKIGENLESVLGKNDLSYCILPFFFTHDALQLPWASLVITDIGSGLLSTHPLLSLGWYPALGLKEQ